jgi:hypothetical protein
VLRSTNTRLPSLVLLAAASHQASGNASLQGAQGNPNPAPNTQANAPEIACRRAQFCHRGTNEFNVSDMAGDASEAALFRLRPELQFSPRKPNARL